MIRRVKISGGPSAADVRITDSETGQDLTGLFTRMELSGPDEFEVPADEPGGEPIKLKGLLRVKLTAFAELDGVEAEAEVVRI